MRPCSCVDTRLLQCTDVTVLKDKQRHNFDASQVLPAWRGVDKQRHHKEERIYGNEIDEVKLASVEG